MKQMLNSYKQQSGFTLIESMLTLFILTIGILGIAGLQMQGMRSANLAVQKMAVTVKTQDLIDRMRGNAETPADVELYATVVAANNSCNSGTICSKSQMAAHDKQMWESDLNGALPGTPTKTITTENVLDPDDNTVIVSKRITIVVNWTDRGDGHTYTVRTQL